ncbi:MAG: GNAT family N-acetyltransferase [Candidatus Kryptoniota bacterium]
MDIKFEMVLPETPALADSAKQLFIEYARSLNFSLCFQDFDKELAGLPGDYVPPSGRLILAYEDGKLAGCVALHKFGDCACEMKRLYLRPEYRSKGIGKKLALKVIDEARTIGYEKMLLDTVPSMKGAISLYRSLGFIEIGPYRDNPVSGALFMELELNSSKKDND